ncbi:hypothetical protein BASA81_000430 [Batrachochytrium salamandrivorans]|nr:hypothetical protein BASA81_000422 [Batrachochytrium salamandrivorans]KAH9261774.1 hypothetical protein BASA81_000430 [Batrachochytrium salamandrivorans]
MRAHRGVSEARIRHRSPVGRTPPSSLVAWFGPPPHVRKRAAGGQGIIVLSASRGALGAVRGPRARPALPSVPSAPQRAPAPHDTQQCPSAPKLRQGPRGLIPAHPACREARGLLRPQIARFPQPLTKNQTYLRFYSWNLRTAPTELAPPPEQNPPAELHQKAVRTGKYRRSSGLPRGDRGRGQELGDGRTGVS